MRKPKRWNPALWASRKPFGIGERRPNNYLEIWNAIVENRDQLGYAWRILTNGVCDGCALGTSGLRDWTVDEVHLCNIRLRLLRLNTMPALDPAVLADVAVLRGRSGRELRALGRLPYPMLRRRGEPGFRRISWDEALDLVARRIRATTPDRLGFYLTGRGMPNESYYAAQKAVRALGTNSIDNAARICHAPSTVGLKEALGVAATTCSYRDWIGSDLVVFIGSNVANNQPVSMKYLYHAKRAGTRVVVVNTYREPGMERYWVPSNLESALFGTKIADRFFLIDVGGDVAFLNGALKAMIAEGWVDRDFIERHTTGFDALAAELEAQPWEALERLSGVPRSEMHAFARMVGEARTAVFVWGMGVTQHACGEDNVRAIINLALSRGFVGREKCGLMPIRGHSGIQGGAEMGAYATALPGGVPVDAENAARFSRLWGFEVPTTPGLTAPEMIDRAHDGDLDVLVSAGGNFLEVLPDPAYVEAALARVPLRVHMDIVVTNQMLVDPAGPAAPGRAGASPGRAGREEAPASDANAAAGDGAGLPPDDEPAVLLLPAATRYETPGGVTETTTERRVVFSPEIPGRRIGEARPEWEVFLEIAARARPGLAERLRFRDTADVRREIALAVPVYDGIQHLRARGDQFQYGGPHLCAGWDFPTPDGRARFSVVRLPERRSGADLFTVTTRRGKQFNTMVHEDEDPLTGAARDRIYISRSDAERLGFGDGDAVVLRSEHGEYRGRLFVAPVKPGNLEVHWPEANALVDRSRRSRQARIPDYNAVVRIERAG